MEDDPLPLVVGITYNLKKGIETDVEDYEAEYDNMETILSIKAALESAGHRIQLFEADTSLFNRLNQVKPHIIFNIAEGINGRGREAQVPAILNFLEIPFTGSDETTLCISLDKALTKRLLSSYKIKTPRYRVVNDERNLPENLKFPLIVKPNAEGSSKGISDLAVVHDFPELRQVISRSLQLYRQPLLVEEFIEGREFTVGIIGNDEDIVVFEPMEIVYKNNNRHNIYSYSVKKDFEKHVYYSCPAEMDNHIAKKMKETAEKIYRVLGCRDFGRIDFMLSKDNEIYFIEINPLPGLAPGYSDYPMLAGFCGVGYNSLINKILNCALKRYSL